MGREISASSVEQVHRSASRSIVALQDELSRCASPSELLELLGTALAALLPVKDRVSIVFLEPDQEWMRIYRVLPIGESSGGSLPRVRVDNTPVGRVVREGVARVVTDVRSDPNITFGHASHDRIRSTLSVPIRVGGRVIGAMNAGSSRVGACTEAMLQTLAEIASCVGPATYAAEQVFEARRAQLELARAQADENSQELPAGLVGCSDAFQSLIIAARRAAKSDADVLITGETGVGKTALARAMHSWSARESGPFVTVHIADLSSTIVESELFGHERGAFTGALGERVGRFENARGGTVFLDEVGETQPSIQSKLLRVIQERCFERVGGSRTIETDVRIIAATSRDLRQSIARGEFREDLFYRLNVVPLWVPPLRDRMQDLRPLVSSILTGIADGNQCRRLSNRAWQRVHDYSWPGNIRELESVLRRAVILEDGEELQLESLAEGAKDGQAGDAPLPEREWPTLEEHQLRYIEEVLQRCGGVIEGPEGAAQLLGMRPSTLRSRITRFGASVQAMRERGKR